MKISEHANYLLNEYGRLQFDYAAYCKPDGEPLRDKARYNLEEYIADLEKKVDSAMSKELKPCPFCGGTKICTEKGTNLNYCDNCSAESNVEHWNTRPIEDALTARIAELKGVIEILEDQQREAKNIFIDKKLHIDSLYEEGFKLQQRIAEVEAAQRWRVVADGELPEDGEPVLAAYVDTMLTAAYYRHHIAFGGVDNWWDVEGCHTGNPTHWMPLPYPPEVK